MDYLKQIEEKILSQIASPQLAVVDKVYINQSEGGYCLDATVVKPESLELTEEIIKEVAISPIWADTDGRGIYAPPATGQIVIIGFISNNKAWPFLQGIWANNLKPSALAKTGELLFCDGKGCEIVFDAAGKMIIKNNSISLKVLLEEILDLINSIQCLDPMSGPLPLLPTIPPQIAVTKNKIKELLKE